jgi:phosphoenolpyruvate carboxylase
MIDSSGCKPNRGFLRDRIEHEDQIKEVLDLCYRSLQGVGSGMLADGRLLDLIVRVEIFGLSLLKMDLRQESTRHTELLCEICSALEQGNYMQWSEEDRCKWLVCSLWPEAAESSLLCSDL